MAELDDTSGATWRDYKELTKPNVVLLMLLTSVIGMFMAVPGMAPLRVLVGSQTLAATGAGRRVCEPAGAPTYYFPPDDVDEQLLSVVPGASLCEWKGVATGFSAPGVPRAAWCYQQTFPEFEAIAGWYAFYPGVLACYVGEEQVAPQPGGYYGGWVTPGLRGPIKGEPGSEAW